MGKVKNIALLGATGSIGKSALSVIRSHPETLSLYGVSAHTNMQFLEEIIEEFKPRVIVVTGEKKPSFRKDVKLYTGIEGLEDVARDPEVDIILVATTGTVGVFPTIEALKHGKRVALANKETLVAFGDVVKRAVKDYGGEIIPVDSEHSAIFQLLEERKKDIERIILTASGGPFRNLKKEELDKVTPQDALRHPTWKMGKKITVDSATLFNKALEIIEANRLFDFGPEKIEVVIHPESIIHGAVILKDGAFLAHLSPPDMRIPIQYALSYPERWGSPARFVPLHKFKKLTFEIPDTGRFPALLLGYRALREGGTMPAVLNAANEIAVGAFLKNRITFPAITEIVEKVMNAHTVGPAYPLKRVLEADYWARQVAEGLIATHPRSKTKGM